MKVLLRVALACAASLCLPLSVWATTFHYNSLANFRSFGYGINASGQVIGEANNFASASTTYLWDADGTPHNLGAAAGFTWSRSFEVNDLGQAVGWSRPDDFSTTHATLWSGGSVIDLGNQAGFGQSNGMDINNAGQVLMYADIGSVRHYYIWTSGGGYFDLNGQAGFNDHRPVAIDNAGRVFGRVVSGGTLQAFMWTSGGGFQNLGALPSGTFIQDVNQVGQMIGQWSETIAGQSVTHSFLWTNGAVQDLGHLTNLSTSALGLNDLGQIVGSASNNTTQHAFLWTSDGGIQDLNNLLDNPPGFDLNVAWGINNAGQIGGWSQIVTAFRLDPVVVPEPSTLVLAACGLVALALCYRRRRGR